MEHEKKSLDNGIAQETQEPDKSFFGVIIHSFFVVPFLIAVFAVLLFAAVRLLTSEQRTIYDYLSDVKTGGLTKRWQAAFELSRLLAEPKLIPKEERFRSEMLNAFEHSRHDDNRVRQYLALAMGRTGNLRFVEPLLFALKDETAENRYAIIYALGMLADKKAAPAIQSFLDDPDAKVRLFSVIALGQIGDRGSVPFLKKSLGDSEVSVGWEVAVALAKMSDASGKQVLLKLLDRGYLAKFPEVDAQEQTHVVLVAIEAASNLKDQGLAAAIERLATSDPNMNVRKAALSARNGSPTNQSVGRFLNSPPPDPP